MKLEELKSESLEQVTIVLILREHRDREDIRVAK